MPLESFVAIDVETTGLSVDLGDRVIEIGAVAVELGQIKAEFSTLIGVDCQIHLSAEQVHGISSDMLIGEPSPEEVWPSFMKFIGDSPLVAHNARFDLGFIGHEIERLGMSLHNKVHCSLEQSRRRYPRLTGHKLEVVALHLLGSIPEDCRLHRALGDARLLTRVWLAMMK